MSTGTPESGDDDEPAAASESSSLSNVEEPVAAQPGSSVPGMEGASGPNDGAGGNDGTTNRLLDGLSERLSAMAFSLIGPGGVGGPTWDIKAHPEVETNPELKRVVQRTIERRKDQSGLRLWRSVLLALMIGLPLLGYFVVLPWENDDQWYTVGLFGFMEIVVLLMSFLIRARLVVLDADLQLLAYEQMVASFGTEQQHTAANLFFKHQAELKRYYDQTLSQHRGAYVLGVVVVVFGLLVVTVVAVLVATTKDTTTGQRALVTGLGVAGALLSGFVARVYLSVFSSSAKALNRFHGRLVETNNMHFANLLISGLVEAEARDAAVVGIAQATARPRQ